MKNKIKYLGIAGALAVFILLGFMPKNDSKLIVIDAAHGGKDSGAISGDLTEKQIVQSIAWKIKSLNKNSNLTIVLLREEDNFIELKERVSKINMMKPDLMISLHINSAEQKHKNGVSAYVSRDGGFYDRSLESANILVNKLSDKLVRGEIKDANYFVLKNSNCPAVTLEIGYLTNEIDRKLVGSEDGQVLIAEKILESLE